MTFYRVPFTIQRTRNLCLNGSFEHVGTYGWFADALANDPLANPRPAADPVLGERCLSWNTGGLSGTTSIKTAVTTPTTGLASVSSTLYYKFEAWKTSAAQTGHTVEVRVQFYDAAGVLITVPAATWQAAAGVLADDIPMDVEGSVSIAPGAVSFVLGIRVLGANGIGNLCIDGVMISTDDSPYIDGDTPNLYGQADPADDRYAYWTGAPGASEAVQTGGTLADRVSPDLGVALPFAARRELRTVAARLLDSDDTRTTYIPAGPRTGTYRAGFHSPADAIAAMEWFASGARFHFQNDGAADYADMSFTLAEGDLELWRAHPGVELVIPFVEKLVIPFVEAS